MIRKPLMLVLATLAVAGCTFRNNENRRPGNSATTVFERLNGGGSGQVIEPKRCKLKVIILPRPLHDALANSSVWHAADEQVIPPDVRHALEANGLRVGVMTGNLPADVEKALNAPPPDKVDPAEFDLPDGSNTLVSLTESNPVATIMLALDGRAAGKDYKDATGWLRVTANQDGPTGVALRFVPEIHHGPVQRRFDALPSAPGTMGSMQFGVKDGQLEETFRELAASLTLQPGQLVVIGCNPDRRSSVGSFLFTHPEANSDRLIQKTLLVWATRTNPGQAGSQAKVPADLTPVDPPDEKKTKTGDSK